MKMQNIRSFFFLFSFFVFASAGAQTVSRGALPDGPASPFIAVAEHLRPTVVSISVRKTREADEYFWDPERGSAKRYRSAPPQFGSGVILSVDGYVLTNNHVIDRASSLRVTLSDNTEYNARIVGQDPETDIALIRLVTAGRLRDDQVAPVGDSDALRVGEWVVAVGNPFGFQRTVSVGVVSAKGRLLEEIEGGTPSFQDFIQTDASINPGNSGGPLANLRGEVVGVNTAYRPSGPGVGFAIPINIAARVARELRETGRVVRGFLGVHPQELTADLAEARKVTPGRGILVGDVQKESPADQGGIRRGDVILEVGAVRVRDVVGYLRAIADLRPGARTPVSILRGGAPMTATCVIRVRPLPASKDREDRESSSGFSLAPEKLWMGLIVHDRGTIEARRANGEADEGVVVTYVAPGSASEEKGVGLGDAVLEVEGVRVSTMTDYQPLSRKWEGADRPVLILIRKKGEDVTTYVALRERN
jgi:Do/DeqQ family serine protease